MRFDPTMGAMGGMGAGVAAPQLRSDPKAIDTAPKQPAARSGVVMANSAAGTPMAAGAPGPMGTPMSRTAPLAKAYAGGGLVSGGSSRGCGLARPGKPGKGAMR